MEQTNNNEEQNDSILEHEYKTADEIYNAISHRIKKPEDFRGINVMGIFVCLQEGNTIVLEDGTHDSYFYVRPLNQYITAIFKPYFRPGFIFRFLSVDCTATQTSSLYNPKTIRINATNSDTAVVFEWLTNSENDRFSFYSSHNPMILPSDWEKVEALRQEWCTKISRISINDLSRILTENRKVDFKKVTFVSQIVEIKQPSPGKLILKVWDGTTPDFNVRLPLNQLDLASEIKDFQRAQEQNYELEEKSVGKAMYILVSGDHINSFLNRRPGQYILLIKAKIYFNTTIYPNIFRCEMTDLERKSVESPAIVFLKENSNLGQLLTKKLLSHITDQEPDTSQPSEVVISDSFEQGEYRNIVLKVQKFKEMIKQEKNYQIFCKIVDVFPLNYTTFDLINLKCSNCNLNESISNIFNSDGEGLRRAAEIFVAQHGSERNDINCPNCLRAKAHFNFSIIFLLEDEFNEQIIALLEGNYCNRFFEMDPLQLIADTDREEIFSYRFQDLLRNFSNFNSEQPSYMVINKSKKNYYIKSISINKKLVL